MKNMTTVTMVAFAILPSSTPRTLEIEGQALLIEGSNLVLS
jgi:hypothetical protein